MTARLDENIEKARRHLARFERAPLEHFIDGAFRPAASGELFDDFAPVDGLRLGRIAAGDARDVDLAAAAAARAFPAWRDLPGAERRRLLHRIADAVEARAEETLEFCGLLVLIYTQLMLLSTRVSEARLQLRFGPRSSAAGERSLDHNADSRRAPSRYPSAASRP